MGERRKRGGWPSQGVQRGICFYRYRGRLGSIFKFQGDIWGGGGDVGLEVGADDEGIARNRAEEEGPEVHRRSAEEDEKGIPASDGAEDHRVQSAVISWFLLKLKSQSRRMYEMKLYSRYSYIRSNVHTLALKSSINRRSHRIIM